MAHNETKALARSESTTGSPKPRRIVALVAALTLAGVLGGCVVYPAGGPGWGYHDHWHGGYGWR